MVPPMSDGPGGGDVKNLLARVNVYIGVQKVFGADRLRTKAIAEAGITPGDRVLDIGCGPAYYLDRLPAGIDYYGFDTHLPYLEWARRRWPQARFHHGIFDETSAPDGVVFDVVLLLGLLHHIDDPAADALLSLCGRMLAPGGRVVSADTAYEAHQKRFARWMSDNDRGEHVRPTAGYREMAERSFSVVRGRVVDVMRVPTTQWLMVSSSPRG